MRFSVVVPVLNEEKTLSETLKSIRSQTLKDFELIVVDNGSTDGSVEIAREYADMVLFEEKKGSINAIKRGFSKATGEILVCCDADSIYPKDYLEKLDRIFKDEKVVAVYGPFIFKEKGKIFNIGSIIVYTILNALSSIFGVPLAGAANFAIRKKFYERSGGYNFGDLASQDFRLARKLKAFGKVVYSPKLIVMTSYRRFERQGLIRGLWRAFLFWLDVALNLNRKKMEDYYERSYYEDKGL